MSGVAHGPGTLDDVPAYDDIDLGWSLDDHQRPTEITVYDVENGSATTTWLTMSLDYALNLEECR